jgi:hypothetical protein
MKRLLVLPSQTDGSPCALPVKRADERELWVHVLWEVAMRSSVPGRLMRDWIEDHGNADFLGDWDGANELALIEVCGNSECFGPCALEHLLVAKTVDQYCWNLPWRRVCIRMRSPRVATRDEQGVNHVSKTHGIEMVLAAIVEEGSAETVVELAVDFHQRLVRWPNESYRSASLFRRRRAPKPVD